MRVFKLLLPVVLVVCVSVVQADTILVPSQQPTIQAGIDAAVDGDTVLVADGTYTGEGNRDIDFGGKAIVVMSENGAENCVIDCEGSNSDPHRGFYIANAEGSGSVVQGFTIQNGYTTGHGGGMYIEDSSPTVTNCTFSGNTCRYYGSGMYNANSSPTVTNCTFSGNHGNYGSGMYNYDSSPTVTNCTFSGNTSTYYGGGMYNANSSPTVTNCTFSGNSAGDEGGGMRNGNSSPTVTNCILWGDIPDEIDNAGSSNPVVTYSDVEGGYAGEGNIDEDPMFVLADKDDHRLLWPSPCIDTGDLNLFDPDGTRSDMGAHYFNQDDYMTLYLTPDVTEMLPGDELGVTYTAINRWNSPEPFWLLSQVFLPGGSSLNVLGPDQYTLPANYTAQVHITHPTPHSIPTGMYEYRSLIGVPPGTLYDNDSFKFWVTE